MELMENQQKQLSELTLLQRQQALNKYRLIEPHLQREKTLRTLSHENDIPLRTLKTWVQLYQKHGLVALARKTRNDKGKNRSLTSELHQLIEGLYLKSSHLGFANIYRQIKTHQINAQLPCPSYRTVCVLLNQLPKPMTLLAHKGSKACVSDEPVNLEKKFQKFFAHDGVFHRGITTIGGELFDFSVK